MTQLAKDLEPSIELKPLPLLLINKKKLSYDEFQDCLDIYENNQLYYRDNVKELKKLEKWFSGIGEPYPEEVTETSLAQWRNRENNRRKYGVSDYCREELRSLLIH